MRIGIIILIRLHHGHHHIIIVVVIVHRIPAHVVCHRQTVDVIHIGEQILESLRLRLVIGLVISAILEHVVGATSLRIRGDDFCVLGRGREIIEFRDRREHLPFLRLGEGGVLAACHIVADRVHRLLLSGHSLVEVAP